MTPKIRNEKRRLSATFLNGVGIALIAVGGFSPVVSAFLTNAVDRLLALFLMAVCFVVGFGLHYAAQIVLNALEADDG